MKHKIIGKLSAIKVISDSILLHGKHPDIKQEMEIIGKVVDDIVEIVKDMK